MDLSFLISLNLVLIEQQHLESGLDHSCVFGTGQRNRIAASECRTRALVDGLDADAIPCDRIERRQRAISQIPSVRHESGAIGCLWIPANDVYASDVP